MKSMVTIFLTLAFITGLSADIFISEESHTDSYYYGGMDYPAEDRVSEIWLGKDRMAYITPNRKIIIDQTQNTITIANRKARSYVQTTLPLEMAAVVDPAILEQLKAYQTRGTVESSQIGKTIEGYNCRLYDITVDAPTPLDIKIWASTDVPFSWKDLREKYRPVMRLANYSPQYIEAMMNIEGLAIVTDVTIYLQGSTFKSRSRISEISEKTPPEDAYRIPADFTSQEKLSLADLRNR